MQTLYAGRPCPEMLDYLLHRRSVKNLTGLGPDDAQIAMILQAAMRVPDHGKLFPWYFVVFTEGARAEAGAILRQVWQDRDPEASPAKLDLEAERFLRAPVVIAVVSKIRESKNPAWEQMLSTGAACMNLCLAANALGFATNWLSEWYSYDAAFLATLGVGDGETIGGFIYIGTPAGEIEERQRPEASALVTYWRPDSVLRKGEQYGQIGKGCRNQISRSNEFRQKKGP